MNPRGTIFQRLTDKQPASDDDAHMAHFKSLDPDEQVNAIRRLAAAGASEFTISAATRLSVEMIRRVLENAPTPTGGD